MKSILLGLPLIFLIGCIASVPKNANDVYSSIKISKDEFKGQTWIRSETYSGTGGTMVTSFPARIYYRALYEKNKLLYIQLYTTVAFNDWSFIESAISETGDELEFHQIDRSVSSGTVTEEFAITITKDDLRKMSEKDWQIKYYGKRGNGVEIVPKFLSEGFLMKLECYTSNTCNN